jgi:hypothetical protein
MFDNLCRVPKVKPKLKFYLYIQMFSSSHSSPWHYMGVSSLLHSPAAYPKDRAPGTHLIEGWVGPRGSLIFEEQKKSLALNRNVNAGSHVIIAPVKSVE